MSGQIRRSALPCLAPAVRLALVAAVASPCAAQTKGGAAVEAVRGIDRMGMPAYDFEGSPGATYACTAFDAGGVPLATATAEAAAGMVMFPALGAAEAARVACRET